ncbi:MAG: hypothetical protein KZQ84_08340 [Candidatus Thiodiazotropha sp. (ex Lucinoma borealis)]|nr:hypothetical protein [Candidatus Thiodiazotropha sp. (ex Lucinoma borealis)]
MMIKKTLVAVAIVSIFTTTTAQAVNLSQDTTGQVLLYPYYNVNEGNVTFVSVTNTTDEVKAAKVRFREGVGGESVFDLSLYLSPRDVWVGAVYQQAGAVKLSVPADTSCTVPNTAALESNSFSSARIDAAYDPDGDGTQTADEILARLSEGHIEVIEMAELPYTTGGSDIADAVTHYQHRLAFPVTPVDCSVAVTFTDTTDLGAILDAGIVTASGVSQDFANPGGGLYGDAAIFNANSGIYFPYNATALKQFAASPIWWPQNTQPFTAVEGAAAGVDSAGNAIANYRTADNGTTVPQAGGTLNIDLPDLSTPTTAEVSADSAAYHVVSSVAATGAPAINTGSFGGAVAVGDRAMDDKASAVSAALTGRTLMSNFLTTGDYATDWIVTFPTRYTKVSDNAVEPARAPFTGSEDPSNGMSCHSLDIDLWNREEDKINNNIGILPLPRPSLCYVVNVQAINNSSGEYSAATASKAVKIDAPIGGNFSDGWVSIDLSEYTATPAVGSVPAVVRGLPVLGFTAVADTVSGTERGGVFPSRILVDEQ